MKSDHDSQDGVGISLEGGIALGGRGEPEKMEKVGMEEALLLWAMGLSPSAEKAESQDEHA